MALSLNRRAFLGSTGAMALAGSAAARSAAGGIAEPAPVRVYVVYLGTGGAWPKPEFDAPREIAQRFAPHLAATAAALGDVEFCGGDLIANNGDDTICFDRLGGRGTSRQRADTDQRKDEDEEAANEWVHGGHCVVSRLLEVASSLVLP